MTASSTWTVMTMNYKQYDTRWCNLLYPKKPWLIRNCGCGEVSICNSIIEMATQEKQTPKTIQPYMVKFAESKGNGTFHYGIPTAMKHYGLTDVMEHPTMPKLFAELKKGNRLAVLLMGSRKGGSKKVHWTGSGHFVACTDYYEKDGKHYMYIKDSASTSNLRNGWLTYEENIKGDCLKVWSGAMPTKVKAPTKGNYTGSFPSVYDGWRVIDEASANKGKYATRTKAGKDKKPYHNKFTLFFKGKPGINSKGEMSTCYGYTPGYCTLFACYCLVKAGLEKYVPFSKLNSKANGYWWHAPSLMKYYKSKGWLVTSAKKAEVGAIAFKGKGMKPTHTCNFVKYENGYVYTWDGNVGGGVSYNKRKASVFCGFANLPYKSYMTKGDKGVDVTKWQKFLNWYFGNVVAEDGVYGDYTYKYTEDFQTAEGITADGTVGYQTVKKAKEVTK